MRSRLVPLFLVSASLFVLPAVASAGLGVGTSAPFDPAKIRAVRSQELVAAAVNDSVTLYAWTDFRSGNADIYAARVRHDGTVLDPNGIAVALTAQAETAPAVSWSGTEWLVAWERGTAVLAARVDLAGEVLDPAGLSLGGAPYDNDDPAAAGLGGRHLVTWTRRDVNSAIVGAIVAPDGTLDVAPTVLSLGATPADFRSALAVRDTAALVAFTTNRNGNNDLYGFRVRRGSGPAALLRMDVADVAIANGPERVDDPAAGASANGWLVAWTDGRNAGTGASNDVYAARLNASGAVEDASGIRVSDDPGNEVDPAVHHTGNEWLVAFSEQDAGQFLQAVMNNGNPTGPRLDVSTVAGTLGDATFGGDPDKPTIAWSEAEPGTSPPKPAQDLLGRLIGTDLSFDTPFVIATQTPNQTQPVLSFGANRWFVAWVDDRFGPTEGRLRYAVTDSQRFEAPSPASIFDVAPRPGLDQQQPTACFDGTNFNLYWVEERSGYRQVFGARFTTGGAFIDTFQVTTGAWDHYEPTAARLNGAMVVLAWTDRRLPGNLDIWGRRIVHGAPFGDEGPVVQDPARQDERPKLPARTVDPGDFRIPLVYQARTTPGTGEIRETDMDEDLNLYGNSAVTFNAPTRVFEAPQIAWNGENWFVTYHEIVENDGPELYVPWGQWLGVGFSGTSAPQALGPGSYVPANPVAGATGHNYLALWSELAGSDVDLMLRRSNGNGGYVGPALPYTADAEVDVPGAALQGAGGDRVGFAYLRAQDDEEWSGLRLFGAEARDTLEGRIVINEFLANPASQDGEFLELHNVSGQSFNLEGWWVVIDGDSSEIFPCQIDGPGPGPDASRHKGGDDVVQGTQCGEFPDATYHQDPFDLDGIVGSPEEGKIPNRGARIELFSPGGVKVDEVAYGYRGGAPVSPPIPTTDVPAARTGDPGFETAAAGDSTSLSTARLPNGTDTDNDADDWNLTSSATPNNTNTGTAAALGSGIFVTRVFWNPASQIDAIELYNPTSASTFDFDGWYIGSNDGTQRIGVRDNAWTLMPPLDKRVLRRGELGSFTTDLDYLTVLYLLDPNFQRVEQIGWSRPDNQQPELCLKREPDTGGFHDGFDWFTSGGEQNLFAGQLRYVTCEIAAPDGTTPVENGPVALAFRGAVPNPLPAAGGALVFTVPGVRGGAATPVRLRLVDVAGRARATLVSAELAPGEHRVPLAASAAGVYYAELEVAGRRISRPVVVVP